MTQEPAVMRQRSSMLTEHGLSRNTILRARRGKRVRPRFYSAPADRGTDIRCSQTIGERSSRVDECNDECNRDVGFR